jgi:hypothetical protein
VCLTTKTMDMFIHCMDYTPPKQPTRYEGFEPVGRNYPRATLALPA